MKYRIQLKALSYLILLSLFSTTEVLAEDNIEAFPAPEEGEIRYVLQLPERPDEDSFKVELIVGKKIQVDSQNRYFFVGNIEAEIIQGWGFTRYVVKTVGPLAGTLMAVDSSVPKTEKFIVLGGGPYLISYNGRLPVVVYVPTGYEVHYRLWSATAESIVIEKG